MVRAEHMLIHFVNRNLWRRSLPLVASRTVRFSKMLLITVDPTERDILIKASQTKS